MQTKAVGHEVRSAATESVLRSSAGISALRHTQPKALVGSQAQSADYKHLLESGAVTEGSPSDLKLRMCIMSSFKVRPLQGHVTICSKHGGRLVGLGTPLLC